MLGSCQCSLAESGDLDRAIIKHNRFRLISLGLALAIVCLAQPRQTAASGGGLPPHLGTIQDGFRYGFPPHIDKKGLIFAGETVPLGRRDVRDRILKEINYFLQDKRSLLLLWLARADHFKPVMVPILKQYGLPEEFVYLSAIESSYNSRALSSAGAYGYWQFIKATALKGPGGSDKYDWRMDITKWKDERADLVTSTHAAARYLAWMNKVKKVSLEGKPERDGFNDWFLATAAYNAGPSRVTERLNAFGATSYWDVALPPETERYVPRWIALALISTHRNFYGVQILRENPISFDVVEKIRLKKDLSFAEMAHLLNTTPRVVWSLNTQIAPEKAVFPAKAKGRQIEHRINVPLGTRAKFLARLAAKGYTRK